MYELQTTKPGLRLHKTNPKTLFFYQSGTIPLLNCNEHALNYSGQMDGWTGATLNACLSSFHGRGIKINGSINNVSFMVFNIDF